LLSLALACGCASAQNPLVKILAGELDRNYSYLKEHGEPPPYFMAYEVTDNESDILVASQGSIDTENHNHSRYLDTTIRVGSPKFDNYRRTGRDLVRFTSATAIAIEDNPASIRQSLWLSTDRVYRAASQRLLRLKSDEKLRAESSDGSDDFSIEEPQKFFSAPPKLKFNSDDWANRLRKLSSEFSKYPGALNSVVAVEGRRVFSTLVTTEGTQLEHGRSAR